MNPKQLQVLLGVLVALLACVMLQRSIIPPHARPAAIGALLPDLDISTVQRLRIYQGDAAAAIVQREGDLWRIESLYGVRTRTGFAEELLIQMADLRGAVRATSTALHSDFGVQETQGFHVVLSDATQVVAHIIIGTAYAGPGELFLRRADAPTVWSVASGLEAVLHLQGALTRAQLDQHAWVHLAWLDMIDTSCVGQSIKRPGADWESVTDRLPFRADPERLAQHLRRVPSVAAIRVADPTGEALGFETPLWQMRFERSEASRGDPIIITVGGRVGADREHYVRIEGTREVYVVNDFLLGKLWPDGSTFIGKNALGIDRTTLTAVDIVRGRHREHIDWPVAVGDMATTYIDYLEQLQIAQIDALPQIPKQRPNQLIITQDLTTLTIGCAQEPKALSASVLCVQEHSGVPFQITATQFHRLFSGLEQLRASAPISP